MKLTAVVTHEPPWAMLLRRADEIFARNDVTTDDTTRLIREQRDAG